MIEDFVELVEAYEIIERYAQFFGMVTGRTYSLEEEWDAAGRLYEVIRDNSIYAGRTDGEAEDTFGAIVNAINIPAADKVLLLTGISPKLDDDNTLW